MHLVNLWNNTYRKLLLRKKSKIKWNKKWMNKKDFVLLEK